MIEALDKIDREIFLYLNDKHSAFWDKWMVMITDQVYWIWLFALILGGSFYYYRKSGVRNYFFYFLIPLLACVIAADHTASSLFKPLFERLRPCHNQELISLVNAPDGCGGQYGFFSSHASNSFAVAGFILLSLKGKWKWWALPVIMWAILFSYSRIYLAKHYPFDILCGALCGLLLACLFIKIRDRYFANKLIES